MSMPVRNEFAVHMLNEAGIARANQLAEAFSALLDTVEPMAGTHSRELSLARTKLQEASFWAKRAMAMNPENQK